MAPELTDLFSELSKVAIPEPLEDRGLRTAMNLELLKRQLRMGSCRFSLLPAHALQKKGRTGEEMVRARRVCGKATQTSSDDEESTGAKGLEKLSQEADKTLDKESNKIAGALGTSAVKGNIACTRLLVELAKRRKRESPSAAQEKSSQSLASKWASEPEWPGAKPSAEKKAEICGQKR